MTDTGASLSEQVLEASRRNNTELLLQIKSDLQNDSEKLSALINGSHDIMGNTSLHLACKSGCWEVIDIILDIEGVEIDPKNKIDGETPLHFAVRYTYEEIDHGNFIIDNLLDAGSDPRIKNKENKKPIDLAEKSNQVLIDLLENAEYAISMEIDEGAEGDGAGVLGEDGDGDEGSASDSD